MVHFPTFKGGHRNERLRHYFHEDMACILEVDPGVLRWSAEVEPIEVEHDDGVVRRFTASMRADTKTGLRLVRLVDTGGRGRAGRASGRGPRPIETREAACEVLTREELARHPLLLASREVLYHRPRLLDPSLPIQASATFAQSRPPTLGAIHDFLGLARVAWEDMLSMVAQGFIDIDLGCKLGRGTTILACNPFGHNE